MSLKSLFDSNLEKNGYEAEFIPSFQQSKNRPYSAVMFHHVKKCAGMGVFMALKECIRFSLAGMGKYYTGRLDDDAIWSTAIDELSGMTNEIDHQRYRLFVASHIAGDYYYDLKDVNRFTILRSPFDRVVSKYKYDSMRNNFDISEKGFFQYIEKYENRYDYLQALVPEHERCNVDNVISYLERDFFAYFDIDRTSEFLSSFCSIYGLPNIVMGKQNSSKAAEGALNSIDYLKYESKFSSDNKDAVFLYDWVRDNAVIPKFEQKSSVNPYTLIVSSSDAQDGYVGRSRIVKTEDLAPYISKVKSSNGMRHFFK